MRLDGVETLEIEQRLDEAHAGRIAVGDRDDVGAERLPDGGVAREDFEIGLADQVARQVLMVEPSARRWTTAFSSVS